MFDLFKSFNTNVLKCFGWLFWFTPQIYCTCTTLNTKYRRLISGVFLPAVYIHFCSTTIKWWWFGGCLDHGIACGLFRFDEGCYSLKNHVVSTALFMIWKQFNKVLFCSSECPYGSFGPGCMPCPSKHYGRYCERTCNCSVEQCNIINGCQEGKFVLILSEEMGFKISISNTNIESTIVL